MPYFEKYFTVEEANALLPELRRIFADIHEELRRLEANDGEMAKAMESVIENGGGKKLEAFFKSSDLIRERLARVNELGVQVKDVRRGLLDFPTLRDGEEVLLCWLLDEPEVAYWHDLVNGFEGRQRI